jgi:hypothetical protein
MSLKKVLLWGALPVLPKCEPFDLSYKRSGNNLGNTLIGNGVVAVLAGYEYVYRSEVSGPEEVNEKCCHIMIPAANFLWKSFDFGYMADFIEKTNIPVTIVGLGAQTQDRSEVSSIHPNTLRLVQIISERSPSLGVRGFYTAEVLAAHGIMNTEVLGCPSLYTRKQLPKFPDGREDVDPSRISVNFSRRVAPHSFNQTSLRSVENALMKLALRYQLDFVAQDELSEIKISLGQSNPKEDDQIAAYFNGSNSFDVIAYFRSRTNYFCSYDDWASYMGRKSASIGSRLHGNLMALINGIPALTIVHDSRTLEICALTGAPYLHINDLAGSRVDDEFLVAALKMASFDLFQRNMATLFAKYTNFLRSHNLNHSLPECSG